MALLVVEDNPDEQKLIDNVIKNARLTLMPHFVRTGEEALSFLNDPQSPRVRLLLLDLNVPGMGGFELLKKMKQDPEHAMIPIVILTSSTKEEDVRLAYASGAKSFLRKFIDYDRFRNEVHQALHYWLKLNTVPNM